MCERFCKDNTFILDYWLEKCVAIVVFVFFGGSRAILRCLSSCSPLLERRVPKAIGDGSQSRWGGTVSSISHHSFNVEGWPIVLSQCGGVGERVAVCKRFCPVFYVKNRTKSSCIILYSSIIWLFEMLLFIHCFAGSVACGECYLQVVASGVGIKIEELAGDV